MTALPYDRRPDDGTPVHTVDLPATPQRDRNIPATAWVEAPSALLHVGDDFGGPVAHYKRRIGRWLLWRSGPASHADARYVAIAADVGRIDVGRAVGVDFGDEALGREIVRGGSR